jgi:hypothetical protein
MTVQSQRRLKLLALAGVLWIGYLAPWPGPWWLEPAKPSIVAIAFALLSVGLGVGSWPVTIVFSLTFFVYGIVVAGFSSMGTNGNLAGESVGMMTAMLYLWSILFSPISLWAPVLFGTGAYAAACKLRPNMRLSGRAVNKVPEFPP